MATIEIDFDIYKELTSRRVTESQTYSEVIREILGMAPIAASGPAAKAAGPQALIYKGVELPNGTQLRATYKGKTYHGVIKNAMWLDGAGKPQSSPSQAAYSITGSGTNGWKFWECSRPPHTRWVILDSLR